MIDDLLKAGKINRAEYLFYVIYQWNELGRELYEGMLNDTFMEEPENMDDGGIKLAFLDGRRSMIRDIRRAFFKINKLLKEINNG